MTDALTADDVASAYAVLETLRDSTAVTPTERRILNHAHCLVQEYEHSLNDLEADDY